MGPNELAGVVGLMVLGIILGLMIGHGWGYAEGHTRGVADTINNPPVELPGARAPHWGQPCPANLVTAEHVWVDMPSLEDDPPGYYRKRCAGCASNIIGPTDASPRHFGGKA